MRAASSFQSLTKVPLSKTSLQGLVSEYGERLVGIQLAEAMATVQVPAGVDEGAEWRAIPEPDSADLVAAMDGCMINVRGEGWKEVKTVAISAVECGGSESGEEEVSLTRTSYRAGLWEAASFAQQQWAEGCRRGLEKAERVICVSGGAAWIWAIVAMCYAGVRCVEILDWWHAVQKLWELAFALLGQDDESSQAWGQQQKARLWAGQLRQIVRAVRLLCPRGQAMPDKVRQGISYLFHHRWRTS